MEPGAETTRAAIEPAVSAVSSADRGRATTRSGLTPAEWATAIVCLVYPFRIFLIEFTRIDLHLGLVSFFVLGTLVVVTVRERPAGFPTALDLGMIAFALVAVADFALMTGPTPLASKGLSVIGRFVVFYLVARLLCLRGEFAGWLLTAIVGIGIAEAVVGALDYHLAWGTLLSLCGRTGTRSFWKMGVPRLYSFAMDPLSVAYIFVLAVSGCIYLASRDRYRALVVVALFTIWQALPLTLSRAPNFFALLLTFCFASVERARGWWFARVSVVALIASGAVLGLRGWNEPLAEYAALGGSLADNSAAVHRSTFEEGVALIRDQPLGHGLGEAGLVALAGGGLFPKNETHYVTLGVQMGVPGVLCFFWIVTVSGVLWLRLLRSADAERRALGRAGSAIWLTLFAGGFFSGTWSILVPELYFWLLTGAVANLQAEASGRVTERGAAAK